MCTFVRSRSVALLVAGVATVMSLVGCDSHFEERSRQYQKTEAKLAAASAAKAAAQEATNKAQLEVLRVECVEKVDELMKTAAAAMKKDQPQTAARVLGACKGHMVKPEAIDLLKRADDAWTKQIERERAKTARAERAAKKKQGVSIGMSTQDALDSKWGRPESVNRSTNRYGTHEQWVYGDGNYLYFENGVLTSIQN